MKPSRSNPIEFRREMISSRILKRDGSGNLVEASVPVELRYDPLTGNTCRLVQYSLDRIIRPDLASLEKRSLELPCPFCPPLLEKVISNFPSDLVPEGIIRCGKAFGFPNIQPYDVFGAVFVMSDRHFVRPDEFTVETVKDVLKAALIYLERVIEYDPAVKHHFIAWNYLPPSGGSLVHPHIQVNAGYFPTVFQKQLLEASDTYFETKGANFWSDLLEQEIKTGERYLGKTGNTHWFTSFVPKGRLSDIIAVFPGKASFLELDERDLTDFSRGLLKILGYIDKINLMSFNMSTYSGFSADRFWAHARITPRGTLLYSPIETSDQFYYQILHDENICIISPEAAAAGLRPAFSI
jgi:UDPglucose--hexose-1-phosphate uridylyltransferase